MQTRLRLVAAALAALAGVPAFGRDLDTIQLLNQAQFRVLSEDLGAALSYKPLMPAEPLGVTGFDIGIAVTGTRLKSPTIFEQASGGSNVPSTLPVPTLRLAKGLPFGIDVGFMAAAVPDSDIRMVGGELRWAVLQGSTVAPAVALRVAGSRLSGVDQLRFNTSSVDVSISKGFVLLTPYAGIGQVWTRSTPRGIGALQRESFTQTKVFGGVNFNLGVVNLVVEADRTGDITSGGVKVGWRF